MEFYHLKEEMSSLAGKFTYVIANSLEYNILYYSSFRNKDLNE